MLTPPVHRNIMHHPVIAGTESMSLFTGHSFPRHAHDQFGIGFIVQGAQRSWSHLGNIESAAGDTIMVNPGEIHDGVASYGPRGWQMIYFCPQLMAEELRETPLANSTTLQPVVRDQRLTRQMQQLFVEICASSPDCAAAEEALMLCLMRIVHYHTLSAPSVDYRSPAITLARQYLDDAPEEDISLSQLAELCGITRFQLIRGFARETGITPHAYLIQARVRLARRLLLAGNTLVDAALSAGFADQSHLTRVFQRQLAVTPGQWRTAIC